jgi:glycosyltransferase involved in cell wall biosynthesis
MPSVAILLCTFNGARFLPAQLSSYQAQSFRQWRLFVSDDGSSDHTLALVAEHATQLGTAPPVIRSGPRQGFVANFLSLVCDPSITADYFAYSDQDDIWEPDKLARALAWLQTVPSQTPAMYCSRTLLIDEQDRTCGFSPLFGRQPSFRNALVQSIAGGNSIVFNAATRRLLVTCGPNVHPASHDWWTYLLTTAAGGQVYYDPVPSVRYRVHPENVIGSNVGWLNRIRRLHMLATGRLQRWTDRNVGALEPFRPQMTAENRALFDLFRQSRKRGLFGRQIGFLRAGVYRQTFMGNLGLVLAVWIRKI